MTKNRYIIYLLLILFSIVSCESTTNNEQIKINDRKTKVTIYYARIMSDEIEIKEPHDPKTFILDTLTIKGRFNFIYTDSIFEDSIRTLKHSYSINVDSFFYFNEYCINIDTIDFNYKKDTIQVIKSYYDRENSADEECDVYWNSNYGLIALYNTPWDVLELFDNEEIKGFALETFYDYIVEVENAYKYE